MTDTVNPMDLAGAYQQLESLCVRVGLARAAELPHMPATPPIAAGAALWSADYANLLLWPCAGNDAASIEAAALEGQSWFDEVLVQGERRRGGRTIDGYLVLALPAAPDDGAREDVRRLELSAQVCRKHLIWPAFPDEPDYEAGRWRRVADVTVLGLPDAEAAPGPDVSWPDIDTEAQALWDDLLSMGLNATVMRDDPS